MYSLRTSLVHECASRRPLFVFRAVRVNGMPGSPCGVLAGSHCLCVPGHGVRTVRNVTNTSTPRPASFPPSCIPLRQQSPTSHPQDNHFRLQKVTSMTTTVLAPSFASVPTTTSITTSTVSSNNNASPDQIATASTQPVSFLELMNTPPALFDQPWPAYEVGPSGSSSSPLAGTLTLFGGGELEWKAVDSLQPIFSSSSSTIQFGEESDHSLDTSGFLPSSTQACGGSGHGTDTTAQRSDVAYLHTHSSSSNLPPLDFSSSSSSVPMSISVLPAPVSDCQQSVKRSFDSSGPDYEEGNDRVNYQPKKARVAVVVEEVPEDEDDRKEAFDVVLSAPLNLDCSPSLAVPMSTTPTVTPIPPPRSPSPPRSHRPVVPSPLAPPEPQAEEPVVATHQAYSFALPVTPPPRPVRRRSRASEIALLKFALDPWLRLSRSLSDGKPICRSAPTPSAPFNPATFPRAGNLRELRRGRNGLPFSFISCEAEAKWNTVDA